MAQQRLYTYEQMIEAFNYGQNPKGFDWIGDMIDSLTPIQLPSDEEIYLESRRYEKYHESMNEFEAERSAARYHGHMQGAKWMRDKIQGGNK